MCSPKSVCRILDNLESIRRDSSSEPQPHCVARHNILEACIRMRFFGCSTARATKGNLGQTLSAPRTLNLTKIGFTLSHAERAARSLCEAVPKVTEGWLGGFWHFWHPARSRVWEFRVQKKRQYLDRSVVLRLGSLCPDFSGHLASRVSCLEVHPSKGLSPAQLSRWSCVS